MTSLSHYRLPRMDIGKRLSSMTNNMKSCMKRRLIYIAMMTDASFVDTITMLSGQVLETPSPPDRDSSFRPVDSAADYPQVNCIHLVHDDFPISKRTFKAQHLPVSEDFIKKECSPRTLQLWAKSSHKAISKSEGRAAEHAFDPPLEENSAVKFGAERKTAQRINSKKSLRFISN
ncbi:hypothetical protein Patl1_00716 [Pistacia atlantica]|uniref:Uncharacterized protein n=1 Tax=Pistacia atlantica TaxID=434234 RepID=A0ACC1CBB7_9ROSI|nr:hypothetical protein Patl1_00716 [Pistacia atlantica]